MSGGDMDNSDLTALYRAGARDTPPQNVDQAILAAGHRHAEQRAQAPMRLAAAALLVCALGFGAWQFLPRGHGQAVDTHAEPYGYSEGRTRAYLMGGQIVDTATADGTALLSAGQ